MPEENTSITERARVMGWKPIEEFRGNPDNWVPAEKFVELGETSLPHLKGTMKVLEQTALEQKEIMEQQAATIESLKQDLTEFVQFSRDAETRAYERALEDLRKEQREARASGDLEKFAEATEAIDEKLKEHPALTKKDDGKPKSPDEEYRQWLASEPNAFDAWKAENKWYTEEPKMFQYAEAMDRFVFNQHGLKLSPSKRLAKVTELVKKEFPDYFGNAAARRGSPVEGDSGGRASSSNGRSYNDLPPEAQKQCDKWTGRDGKGETGTIKGLTRQQYIEQYKW